MQRHELTVVVPSGTAQERGEIAVTAGRPPRPSLLWSAPVKVRWNVCSSPEGPVVSADVISRLERTAQVTVQLHAPWLAEQPVVKEFELESGEVGRVDLPLPIEPPPVPDWQGMVKDFHELDTSSHCRGLQPAVSFPFTSWFRWRISAGKAWRLPLYWAVPEGVGAAQKVRLNRSEQAYWTEVPYQGETDCSGKRK